MQYMYCCFYCPCNKFSIGSTSGAYHVIIAPSPFVLQHASLKTEYGLGTRLTSAASLCRIAGISTLTVNTATYMVSTVFWPVAKILQTLHSALRTLADMGLWMYVCMDYIRSLASAGFKMSDFDNTLVYSSHTGCSLCLCIRYIGKRERIDFAQTVTKYDRRFKVGDNIFVQDCVGNFLLLNLYRLKRGICCCRLHSYT